MDAREFKDYCRLQFKYLENEFGFQEEPVWKYGSEYEVSFSNPTTRIVVQGVSYGFGIEVWLCTKEKYRGFSWADLLAIRKPDFEFIAAKPSDTSEIQKPQLEQAAKALREFASDVLNGDFSIFPLLEDRVREREKAYQEQQEKEREELARKRSKDYTSNETLRELVRQGKKIEAIARVREMTGWRLSEAKEYIEAL
ncbi:hypothetical protein ANRL3_02512 [Anaerolineae bacterium]|nr:hypothetical protein ANRL3_02512 [Anaerolineae bacterium]